MPECLRGFFQTPFSLIVTAIAISASIYHGVFNGFPRSLCANRLNFFTSFQAGKTVYQKRVRPLMRTPYSISFALKNLLSLAGFFKAM